jgi:hypothetical protein
MNKHQKLWLGAGVVAVAGYFYWKSKQPKAAAFATASLAGNAKAGFLAGKEQLTAKAGGKVYGKGGQFLTGATQPVGSQNVGVFAPSKASFTEQGVPQSGQFAKMVGFATANASGAARNVPTENVNTNPVLNPFFKVKGAHVGTPKLWATA